MIEIVANLLLVAGLLCLAYRLWYRYPRNRGSATRRENERE